ncbi:MAG: cell division protein ZapA [Elusimicrobiota bacterium]
MPEKVSVNIDISGRQYNITTDEWEPLYINKLGEILNSELKSVQKDSGLVDSYKIMVLASLKIIDKLLKLQESKAGSNYAIEQDIEDLNNKITEII